MLGRTILIMKGKVSITQWLTRLCESKSPNSSLDTDKDQYELVNQALNLLFEKYGQLPDCLVRITFSTMR